MSAFFNWSGNFQFMMHLLKFCKINLGEISALSLIILQGMSSDCVDFEVSKLLISFRISSYMTFGKRTIINNLFFNAKNVRMNAIFPNCL